MSTLRTKLSNQADEATPSEARYLERYLIDRSPFFQDFFIGNIYPCLL